MTWNRHKRFAKLIRGDVEAWIFGRHISVRRIECDPHTPDKPIIHDPHQKILDIRKYQKLLGWYVAPEYGEPMYIGAGVPKTCELLPKLKAAADGTDRKYIWAIGYENDENAVLFDTDDLSRKKETEAYIALYIAERRQPVEWIACYATEKPGVLDLMPYYLARALPTLDIRNLKTMFLDTNGAGEPLCYRLEDFLPDEFIGRLLK